LRFRFLVLACWLVAGAAGALAAVQLPQLLSTSLAVPGTGSDHASAILASHFGENPDGTFTVVWWVKNPSARAQRIFARRLAFAASQVPGGHAVDVMRGSGIVYGDVVTRLDLGQAARFTSRLRAVLRAHSYGRTYVTGAPAVQHDLTQSLSVDLARGELIAGPVAFVILVLVLGLRSVLVPLVFAACTIASTLGVVFILAHVIEMPSYVPNLVELLGLGLAIDYSLLIVHRFRDEILSDSGAVDDAVARTMATAGQSVLVSATAVATGLTAVLIVPVSFVRSMGIAGVLVPLISAAGALTLQPALLSLLGRYSREPPWTRTRPNRKRMWESLSGFVVRRAGVLAPMALAVLLACAILVFGLRVTPGTIWSIPQASEAARGLRLLQDGVGPGAISPIEIVFDSGAAGRARSPTANAATLRLGRSLIQEPEAFVVAIGPGPRYVDPTGRFGRVFVVGRHTFGDEASRHLVADIRDHFVPIAHFPPGYRVYVGGGPAQGADFIAQLYGAFPWVVLLVLTISYAVLLLAFKSALLPLVATLLTLLSVGATYGLLVVVFRFGVGEDTLRLYQTGQVEAWVPVFLLATLFGLSMDYQVFLVSRMREAWREGMSPDAAVRYGIERTGRVVTAAALIMVVSFSGFMWGGVDGLQEFGVGLVIGVLLDATIVRLILLPSLMGLIGRWSWWLPAVPGSRVKAMPAPLP
jgi:RND superfamily putative drug exporter